MKIKPAPALYQSQREQLQGTAGVLSFLRASAGRNRATENCDTMERAAKAVLREHGYADTVPATGWPRATGLSQAVTYARQVLVLLPGLRQLAQQNAVGLCMAMEAAAAFERMRAVAAFGKEAIAGAAQRRGGRKAAVAKSRGRERDHGAPADWRDSYLQKRQRSPRVGWLALTDAVAKVHGVSGATVRRALPDLAPGKRGRPRRK